MRYQFTHEIPSPPATLRDRAERLLALSVALDAMDPLPPTDQSSIQRAPIADGNAQRFETLVDANRELYEVEFGAFLTEAKQFRDNIENWALEIGNAAKAGGGEIRKVMQPVQLFTQPTVEADD